MINQETKKLIAIELKKIIPKEWKYTLKIKDYKELYLTIRKASINLLPENYAREYMQIHHSVYLDSYFSGKLLEIFKQIFEALNLNNFDYSDSQTDYFHVGYYVTVNIGKFGQPFEWNK